MTQSQASVTEQLAELQVLAVQHGLYDAADWLTNAVAAQDRSFRRFMHQEEAAGAPIVDLFSEAMTRLRSLPVEQRMTALGFVAVAERRRSRWSDNWWYWDADSTMTDPWDENQVLWTEAK